MRVHRARSKPGATVNAMERPSPLEHEPVSLARDPVVEAHNSLLESNEWTDALFQNSPWSFARFE